VTTVFFGRGILPSSHRKGKETCASIGEMAIVEHFFGVIYELRLKVRGNLHRPLFSPEEVKPVPHKDLYFIGNFVDHPVILPFI
jgi:hypothetical protein